ncbi:hypothetical protein BBP40_003783 [Aspergillus hancockii]|nr:hypothetical protein BBP40_003783 [Aspergillus hancockii]
MVYLLIASAVTQVLTNIRGELKEAERLDYINAIWCLRHRPSVLPNDEFPGVRDRFDDFVATHINYTNFVHSNGLLLPWHRHFLYIWETTLREECGYRGTVPYWNWAIFGGNISDSPALDGSATSLSGNGNYDPHEQDLCNVKGECLPRGTGGGCLNSGPFKDFQVHMKPLNDTNARPYAPIPLSAYDYRPRCLSRSLNPYVVTLFNNQTLIDRMQAAPNIDEFLRVMEPSEFTDMGSHGGGHHSIGGVMGDLFTSTQDPIFMLHHSMVDRMWYQWQDQDLSTRLYALNGTGIIYNPPSAPLVTVDTVVEFGVLDSPQRVKDIMDPRGCSYCYRYT